MKLLLYPHGGSGNHGCEAIVRSTVRLTGAEATLFSNNVTEDRIYGLENVCTIKAERKPLQRQNASYWNALVRYHWGDKDAFDKAVFAPIFKEARTCDYALSIGGDNYCYGAPNYIYLINKQLRRQGTKTVLWGCSIDPGSIKGTMLDDLKQYTHIFARESITYNALLQRGITQASLFPDPAFALDSVELPLPYGFKEKNTVGINVSPLIVTKEQEKGITMQNYKALIGHIIRTTDMNIALISHVVWSHNDDRTPLQELYEQFKESGRVVLMEDHNAMELKGYIARCRFLVTARTHASIAAYSQQVPTLVMGYSVKARGIARDIFGDETQYVLPVQTLRKEDDLAQKFAWLQANEDSIRSHYRQMMPAYTARVWDAANVLKTL